jgi:hypothetical protein
VIKKKLILLFFIPFLLFSQQKNKKEEKAIDFAFIPIISYNPSFGMQYGAMVNGYFNVNRQDKISPASTIGLIGNVFTNKTFFVGLFNKMFFKENHWRTKVAGGVGNINFQTYFEMPAEIPNILAVKENSTFIDYSTRVAFIYGECLTLVGKQMYLGAHLVYSSSKTEFDLPLMPNESINLFGFGLSSEYDTRDNVFTPFSGTNVKFKTMSFLESLGSTNTYHNIIFQFNNYFPLQENSTILLRLFADVSMGEIVPFVGKNVVGRDDIRGYTNGKYRANHVYNIQSEYRWQFHKYFGMVAFGGIAIATDDLSGKNYSGILPSIGTGLRYKIIPKRNINIGIDVAAGKNDWGLYFRIGEAFTR